MQFYIDSSDPAQIKRWEFLVYGITTNPKILAKDGVENIEKRIKEISTFESSVSVELLSSNLEDMKKEAVKYSKISKHVVIKVPVLNYDSLKLISWLKEKGIRSNATGCCSMNQAVMAAFSGADYVSLFWGRIGDEGGNPDEVVRNTVAVFSKMYLGASLIVGSIRSVEDINRIMLTGAHIITITPDLLEKLVHNEKSDATIKEFNDAWGKKK